jgi:peroxiredoxin Q/BCP
MSTLMLKENTNAPHFSLKDQEGKIHSLSDYKGSWVVLYFYPKDMTPGCTTEACNFRDKFPEFQKVEVKILGISRDEQKQHKKFVDKYQLPFTLLSDESAEVCNAYEVWQKKNMYGKEVMGIVRSTYLINPEGKVAKVYPKVNVEGHADQLLADLKNLKA